MEYIAIQPAKGGFDQRWISYCTRNGIPYKIVDVYKNNILEQLADCSALFWQFYQGNYKDTIMAKALMLSLYQSGFRIFPDFNTSWHFDDKIAQKYLLESIGAPVVPTYIFYNKADANKWIEKTKFPLVFKLRGGAGSSNVQLVKTIKRGRALIKRAFGRGFSKYDKVSGFKERVRKFNEGKGTIKDIVKGIIRFVYSSEYVRIAGNDRGYVYFQDFVPGNDFDIRVIVIKDKAFAIKRMVRKNDFRASGSGYIYYDKDLLDEGTIKLAFDLSHKLKAQCVAYDFIYLNKKPLVLEISYAFSPEGYDNCSGFWDKNMIWHSDKFDPYGWIIENLSVKK